ncbi:MAG: sialidase family protein [Bacteroidales bacterium]
MKKQNQILLHIIFISLILFSHNSISQEWSDPVNVSPNMPGLDNQPDLCIDKNGILHCVFTHKLDNNWRKIYYAKSTDEGASWTTPEDISLNEDTSLMNPHIVNDSNHTLYVAYDYNTGNPSQTMIHLKTFDGIQWSEPFIVSEGLYNSDHNQLVIDNNDRLYCFWYYGGESLYRYYDNGLWSDVLIPYPDEYYWIIGPIVVDDENNLNCIGAYLEEGQTITEIKVINFQYLAQEDYWTDKTIISNASYIGSNNWDIDINNSNLPHVAYRQKTSDTGPYSDSTMYTYNNGNFWTEPDLVVNDPYEQRIAIDPYNRAHIIDREKTETGYKLVHYQNYGGFWQGYIIDTADNSVKGI